MVAANIAMPDEVQVLSDSFTLDAAGQRVAVSVWAPGSLSRTPCPSLLYCLPGGGMTRGYFDLRVPGNDSHSFARSMAARGFIVAAQDHPGTGGSDGRDDLYRHTPERLAQAAAAACTQVVQRAREGTLLPGLEAQPGMAAAGVGHSMGAMIIALAQAGTRCFDVVALLGFSTRGLPQYVPAKVQALLDADRDAVLAQQVELARGMFGAMEDGSARQADRNEDLFGRGNAEADGVRALRDCAAPILPVPAFVSMLPGNIADAVRTIDVPVLLALGERDMAGPPHEAPAAFSGSGDLTLLILPGAGHSHFLFPARHGLFARLDRWVRSFFGDNQ